MVKIKSKVQIRDKVSDTTKKSKKVWLPLLIIGAVILLIVAGYFLFREKPDSKLATKDTNAEQIVTDIQQQNTTSSQTATPGVEPIDSSKSLNQPLEGASTSTTGKDEGATGKKEKTVEASTTKTGQPSSATSVNILIKKEKHIKFISSLLEVEYIHSPILNLINLLMF